jgi:hypothetical protein
MRDGISLKGPVEALKEHAPDLPIHTEWLAYLNTAANVAHRCLDHAIDAATDEEKQRDVLLGQRQRQILSEMEQLGSEADTLRKEQQEYRKTIEGKLGALCLTVEGALIPTAQDLDEAFLRQAMLNVGAPGFLARPFAKEGWKTGGVVDALVKYGVPALCAMTLGLAVGLITHWYDSRVMREPDQHIFPLTIAFCTAYGLEVILGAFASCIGSDQREEGTVSRTPYVGQILFYLALVGVIALEGAALYMINSDNGGSVPLWLFLLVGAAINASYIGYRLTQARHDRKLLQKVAEIKSGDDCTVLISAVGSHQRNAERLTAIDVRREVLAHQFEQTLTPPLTPRTEATVSQHELEARIARQIAERAFEQLMDVKEPLPEVASSSPLFRKRRKLGF